MKKPERCHKCEFVRGRMTAHREAGYPEKADAWLPSLREHVATDHKTTTRRTAA